MQSVGTRNTTPELALRRLLFAMGYRYRLHAKNLPGRPDIVFPSRKKAIFVNGCFGIYTVAQRANLRSLAKHIGSQNSKQTAIVIVQTFANLKV